MHIGQQILLEKNGVCSKWMDIVNLVNSQDVEVVDRNGADVSETFMEAMDNYKKIALPHLSGKRNYNIYKCIFCEAIHPNHPGRQLGKGGECFTHLNGA